MKLLAIDTSTEACSAALSIAGEVHERYEIAPRGHTQLILPMVETLLSDAGLTLSKLDALAFGCGPGSFTGVRIAASVAQGLAFGANLPVVPVSSLAALAQGSYADKGAQRVLAAIDARMNEVYWGAYQCDDDGLMRLQGIEWLAAPEDVPLPEAEAWFGAGSGWESYADILQGRLSGIADGYEATRYPRARDVARLGCDGFKRGLAITAEHALPVYLRNEVAWKKQTIQSFCSPMGKS